jgi:hypothetical protein
MLTDQGSVDAAVREIDVPRRRARLVAVPINRSRSGRSRRATSFISSPARELCIIGTENPLVFERSSDPKEIDQDLVFIYYPDAD